MSSDTTDDAKHIKSVFTLFDKHKTNTTIPAYNLLLLLELLDCNPTQYDISQITQQLNITNTIDIQQLTSSFQLQRTIEHNRNINESQLQSAYHSIKNSSITLNNDNMQYNNNNMVNNSNTLSIDKLKYVLKDNYGMIGLKLDDMLDELQLENDNTINYNEFTQLFT